MLAVMQPVLQLVVRQMRERQRQAIEWAHEQEPTARSSCGPSLGM
jgi:hypothetical protein